MWRAAITILAMSLVVLVLSIPLLLIGLVYPWRALANWGSVVWARVTLFFAGVSLRIEGREQVSDDTPRFYMGNHQSSLDIPILILALGGRTRFMAKDTLFRIPLFGWVLWQYGFAPIDRSNARTTLRSLERMLARVRRDPISLAVFPEGTRSRDGKLLTFRRGTMKIAQRSGLPVVPFSIDGSIAVHHRDHFAAHPGPVRLVFAQAIPAEEVGAMTTDELHDRVKSTIARQLGQSCEDHPVGGRALAAAEGV